MPNLIPGFVFVIAASLRYEKLDIGCKYSRAKIMGTVMCLCGALVMSFLQNPSTSQSATFQESSTRWILGCSYLLLAFVVFSFSTVLQAVVMREFPAPFTLCVIRYGLGSVLTALVEIIVEGRLGVGSSNFSPKSIVGIVLLESMAIFVCVTYQIWCIGRKGPLFVSMFNPIQTIFTAVLAAITLGQAINLKSLAGMFLLFFGLYTFLWAKEKEERYLVNVDDSFSAPIADVEKPLLH